MIRSRWFFCRLYTDDMQMVLSALNYVRVAYIKHDKCGNEPHYHMLISLKDAKTVSAMRTAIESVTRQNAYVEIPRDLIKSFEYLTHKNNPEKYQYTADDIVDIGKCGEWVLRGADDDKNTSLSLVDDIINGVPYREMIIRYGRDYIINRQKYEEIARFIYQQECISAPSDCSLDEFHKWIEVQIDEKITEKMKKEE